MSKSNRGTVQVPCSKCNGVKSYTEKRTSKVLIDGYWRDQPTTVTVDCGRCGGTGWETESA